MKRGKLFQGIVVLLTFCLILFVLLRRPTLISGTELGYPLPAGAPKELDEVVRGRLAALGFAEGEVERQADLLLVRIPSEKPEDVADVKRLLRKQGRLELRPSAELEVQKAFKESGVVPEGYDAVEHLRDQAEYAPWSPRMLLRKTSAFGPGRIVLAEPGSELLPGGERAWYVHFELDETGAKRFDETAAELYARRPPGLIGILLDGKLVSAPAVMTTEFGGMGRITGIGGEREAKDLAMVLTGGALPVPLDVEPRFERPFQKNK